MKKNKSKITLSSKITKNLGQATSEPTHDQSAESMDETGGDFGSGKLWKTRRFEWPTLNPSALKNLAAAERLVYRAFPKFVMEIARRYFRLEIEGLEHIPRRGAGLVTPNHSGYSGFDAFLLAHEIHRGTGRLPRILTHHFWFLTKATAIPAEKVGFIEATTENGLQNLARNNLVILFPEGEHGNFKATANRYHLQEFKRGFIRMALERQCPIIPVLVIGAEETHINLAQLKLTKFLRGTVLPLPLNIIPLPAKWTIKFLPPIHLPYNPEARHDRELVREIADEIRESMQRALSDELKKRESIF